MTDGTSVHGGMRTIEESVIRPGPPAACAYAPAAFATVHRSRTVFCAGAPGAWQPVLAVFGPGSGVAQRPAAGRARDFLLPRPAWTGAVLPLAPVLPAWRILSGQSVAVRNDSAALAQAWPRRTARSHSRSSSCSSRRRSSRARPARLALDVRVIKCRFQSKRAQRYIRLQLFPSTFK